MIEKGIYKPNKGKQGRPSIPESTLVGTLFLQSWYGLSDPMTEELIHDRISFRKFLDIKDEDTIPDETTICKFRNALIRENLYPYRKTLSIYFFPMFIFSYWAEYTLEPMGIGWEFYDAYSDPAHQTSDFEKLQGIIRMVVHANFIRVQLILGIMYVNPKESVKGKRMGASFYTVA